MSVTPKSHDFIEGYIHGKIEKRIIEAIMHRDDEIHARVSVPKSWFGLRAVKSTSVTLPEHEVSKLRLDLKHLLSQYSTNKTVFEYDICIQPDEQYIEFVFHGTRVIPVKEMTIEQIEKELGYKIKVVSDN